MVVRVAQVAQVPQFMVHMEVPTRLVGTGGVAAMPRSVLAVPVVLAETQLRTSRLMAEVVESEGIPCLVLVVPVVLVGTQRLMRTR